jgi:hypothetical protein
LHLADPLDKPVPKAPEDGEAVYHCMTRVVNGERVIDGVAKEVLRKQLWAVADFCGVQFRTHAILSNHFHVLLKVPGKTSPLTPNFSAAAVLGSQTFVETHLAAYRGRHGVPVRTAPRPLAPITDWGGLTSLRGLRKNVFG